MMAAVGDDAGRQRGGGFTHLRDLIEEALDVLEGKIERRIEERSGFRGPVREDERELSRALDEIAAHRDKRDTEGEL